MDTSVGLPPASHTVPDDTPAETTSHDILSSQAVNTPAGLPPASHTAPDGTPVDVTATPRLLSTSIIQLPNTAVSSSPTTYYTNAPKEIIARVVDGPPVRVSSSWSL